MHLLIPNECEGDEGWKIEGEGHHGKSDSDVCEIIVGGGGTNCDLPYWLAGKSKVSVICHHQIWSPWQCPSRWDAELLDHLYKIINNEVGRHVVLICFKRWNPPALEDAKTDNFISPTRLQEECHNETNRFNYVQASLIWRKKLNMVFFPIFSFRNSPYLAFFTPFSRFFFTHSSLWRVLWLVSEQF